MDKNSYKHCSDKVIMYTDGSCLGNPGVGGYAAILCFKDHEKEVMGSEKETTTNSRMELKAVIEGLKAMKSDKYPIHVISDSQYVVKAINEWLSGWVKKDFKKIKNVDLWKEYLDLSKKYTITAEWVKGHNGHIMNERVDILANNAAKGVN
jgi:ribonuclease HI